LLPMVAPFFAPSWQRSMLASCAIDPVDPMDDNW
jgi:hypothetical protein